MRLCYCQRLSGPLCHFTEKSSKRNTVFFQLKPCIFFRPYWHVITAETAEFINSWHFWLGTHLTSPTYIAASIAMAEKLKVIAAWCEMQGNFSTLDIFLCMLSLKKLGKRHIQWLDPKGRYLKTLNVVKCQTQYTYTSSCMQFRIKKAYYWKNALLCPHNSGRNSDHYSGSRWSNGENIYLM